MILCIADVLTAEEVARIVSKLEQAEFVDGKITAGWHARLVKQNTQLPKTSPVLSAVRDIIHPALQRHALLQSATRAKLLRPVTISRYEVGMHYGTHVDNAVMVDPLMRSDISLTLFLSDPASYDGGELILASTHSEEAFKLAAGSLVLYPTTTLHRVAPVTRGQRLAAVTWLQSWIRHASDRELLFDLETVKQSLFEKYGQSPELDLLSKTQANLMRKWMDL